MANSAVYEKLNGVAEIRIYLEAQGKFTGQADPAEYAAKELETFSEEDLAKGVENFRVVKDEGGFRAGCFVYESGWLQDIFFSDKDALQTLLEGLQQEAVPHVVHFGRYKPSIRKTLEEVLDHLKYEKSEDYEVGLNLLEAAGLEAPYRVVHWNEELDETFQNVYTSFTPHPWPWDVMKYQAGGGRFTPELWVTDTKFQALVAVNRPAKSKTDEAVFNIVISDGEPSSLRSLLNYALQEMSRQAPSGTVHAHANPATLELYRDLGFSVVSQTPVFTFL